MSPSEKKFYVSIRLVGGEKERERLWQAVPMDPQIHINDLKEKIRELTQIPPEYQEIEFRGAPLADTPHPLDSDNEFEKLFVKHSGRELWSEYKNCVDKVLNQQSNEYENAEKAVELYERLEKSNIFFVYYEFSHFCDKNHSKIKAWTGDVKLMRKTTKEYFRNLHDEKRGTEESEFVCYFEEKDEEGWSRTLAFVQILGDDSPTKFNLKPHYYGFNYHRRRWEPDVSELYRYKLLELIGVTPKAHIITNIKGIDTETYVYIATQWDNRFHKLDKDLEEESVTADLLAQIVMLGHLLHIGVHEENCGKWEGTENAAIVDFSIHEDFQVYTNMKHEILTMGWYRHLDTLYCSVRDQYDDNAWLKIAKVHFDRWDMTNKLDLARDQLGTAVLECLEIGFQKRPFNSKFEITPICEETPTEQLNEFIDMLRENLENLRNVLNSVV